MAKGGAFNVSQLIRELGLQTISGDTMRVLETIQPTLQVGELIGLTPPHVPPSAFYGFGVAAAGGLFATFELQVLAPGGLFVEWITSVGAFSTTLVRIRNTGSAGLAILPPAGVASREAPVSIVRQGDTANIGGNSWLISEERFPFGPAMMFVPRGSFFTMQATLANTGLTFGMKIREVPASEHSPT